MGSELRPEIRASSGDGRWLHIDGEAWLHVDDVTALKARPRTITKKQMEAGASTIGDVYERFGQRGDLRAQRPQDDLLEALALAAARAFGLTVQSDDK